MPVRHFSFFVVCLFHLSELVISLILNDNMCWLILTCYIKINPEFLPQLRFRGIGCDI